MNKEKLIERMQKALAREFYSNELDEIFDIFSLDDFLQALKPLNDTADLEQSN